MTRSEMYRRLRAHAGSWDMIVVGGGATGAGVAIDAASRGYDVLLLEQSDFGKGTSSRSTKLSASCFRTRPRCGAPPGVEPGDRARRSPDTHLPLSAAAIRIAGGSLCGARAG